MAAQPEDRYASMVDFQEAIRQYRSHSESISLSARADDDLRAASGRKDYESYARALFGFQEAYELWEGNIRAKDGILEATLAYATRAKQNGDYDLGASLLDAKVPQYEPLLKEIRDAKRDRDARQQRLKTARRIGTALLATVVVVVTVAFFMVQAEKNKTQAALVQATGIRGPGCRGQVRRLGQKKSRRRQGRSPWPTKDSGRQGQSRGAGQEEGGRRRQEGRGIRRLCRPHRPGRRQDRRERLRPGTRDLAGVPARRSAKLGMGTIELSLRPGRARCPHGTTP